MPTDVEALMLRLLEPVLTAFQDFQQADPIEPELNLHRFQASLQSAFSTDRIAERLPEGVGPSRVLREFLLACSTKEAVIEFKQTMDAIERRALRNVKRNPRTAPILRLFQRATQKAELLPEAIFLRVNRESLGRQVVVTAPSVMQMFETRGGVQARAVKEALLDVSETLYRPFLSTVVLLGNIVGDHFVLPNESLGVLMDQAARMKRELGSALDADVGWLRNAAAHRRWVYLPERHAIVAWDLKHPRTEMKVADLAMRVFGLWNLSGPSFAAIVDQAGLAFGRKTGFMELLLESLPVLLASPNGSPEVDQRFEQRLLAALADAKGVLEGFSSNLRVKGKQKHTTR